MWNASNGTRVVGALLIGVVGVVAIACGGTNTSSSNDVTPEEITSFFIEARVLVEDHETDGPFPPDGPVVSNLRWWYEAPGRYRWELESIEPPQHTGLSLMINEGEQRTSYVSNLNRFQTGPTIQLPGRLLVGHPVSLLLGPLQAESMDDWIRLNRMGQPQFDAKLLRMEELLDRRVEVYEFSPNGVYLDEAGTTTVRGTGRIWIDEISQIVLKYEGTNSNSVVAEVTKLEINKKIDASRFTFIAPPGALETERPTGPITQSGSVGLGGRPSRQPGLLEIGYVPDFEGVVGGGSSTGSSMGILSHAENNWTLTDGRALRINQYLRASGFPDGLVSDEQIPSSISSAGPYNVLRSDDGNNISLAWQDGDIFVMVDGIGLDLEYLLKIARSMVRPSTEVPADE